MKEKKKERYDAVEDMSDGGEDFTYPTERVERISELIDFVQLSANHRRRKMGCPSTVRWDGDCSDMLTLQSFKLQKILFRKIRVRSSKVVLVQRCHWRRSKRYIEIETEHVRLGQDLIISAFTQGSEPD